MGWSVAEMYFQAESILVGTVQWPTLHTAVSSRCVFPCQSLPHHFLNYMLKDLVARDAPIRDQLIQEADSLKFISLTEVCRSSLFPLLFFLVLMVM